MKKRILSGLTCVALVIAIIAFAAAFASCASLKRRSIADDIETLTNRVKVADDTETLTNRVKVADGIKTLTNRVETVCTAVELFEAVGVEAPGTDRCKRAIKLIDSAAYVALYDVASCVQDNDIKSTDFAVCVARVEPWKRIAETLRE